MAAELTRQINREKAQVPWKREEKKPRRKNQVFSFRRGVGGKAHFLLRNAHFVVERTRAAYRRGRTHQYTALETTPTRQMLMDGERGKNKAPHFRQTSSGCTPLSCVCISSPSSLLIDFPLTFFFFFPNPPSRYSHVSIPLSLSLSLSLLPFPIALCRLLDCASPPPLEPRFISSIRRDSYFRQRCAR